jgi:uncharacterized lipoprotein YmbA
MKILTPLLLAAALAGCASAPLHYYTLDPVPPTAATVTTPGPTLLVGSVILPATLDRVGLVRRAGEDRIDIADSDRWAGPLDDLLRQALTRDLALRLPGRTVLTTAETPPAGDRRYLTVSATEFDGDIAGHVVLEAHWTLFAGTPAEPIAQRQERIAVDASDASPAATVNAMSAAAGVLADRIAAALADMP